MILQTPYGLLVVDVDYDQELFEKELRAVQQNYFGHYLVEMFERRVPRRLEPFKLTIN